MEETMSKAAVNPMWLVNVLQLTAWGEKHFGGITTNRHLPLRNVRKAIEKGLVQSIGQVSLCDGDGFMIEPERYREGFTLTAAGRAKLVLIEDADSPASATAQEGTVG